MERKYEIGIVPPARGEPVGNGCSKSSIRGTPVLQPRDGPIEKAHGKLPFIRAVISSRKKGLVSVRISWIVIGMTLLIRSKQGSICQETKTFNRDLKKSICMDQININHLLLTEIIGLTTKNGKQQATINK